MAGCNNRNDYLHSGTSRASRVLQALLPAYAKVDERTAPDLILFAREYARYLNFYSDTAISFNNELPVPSGDWTVMMKMDVSVTLASIIKLETDNYFSYFDYLINTIQSTDISQLAELKKYYTCIFQFVYSLIYRLDEEWQHLPADFGFTEYFSNLITSQLNELFARVAAYYTYSTTNNLTDDATLFIPDNAPIEIKKISDLTVNQLSTIWEYTGTFTVPVEGITEAEKIKYIAQHSIFKGTIEQILKSVSFLSKKANEWLDITITSFPTHVPHYALYLTFIQLFRYAQNKLNNYTANHLDFYYKQILQLKNNPAQPDSVHLIIELAKQTDTHLLSAGTVFKADKDANGLERFYAPNDDTVLNKGNVKSIKSLLVKNTDTSLKIYAAPVANSGDGNGAAISTKDKSWSPFGNNGNTNSARTGFSIAHSILFMKEGARTANIIFKCADTSSVASKVPVLHTWFKVQYTGAKGWCDATLNTCTLTDNQLTFPVVIDAASPAVVPYNEKIHATNYAAYKTALPIIEFSINTNIIDQSPHLLLNTLQIAGITISINVSGAKDVTLQNETSILDASKPFEPFSTQPHIGSSLTIGSNELFLKNNENDVNVTLNITWDKIIGANIDYTRFNDKEITTSYLQNGSWKPGNETQTIFPSELIVYMPGYIPEYMSAIELNLPKFDNEFNFSANNAYDINSASGFMRITFSGPNDFGHSNYVQRLTAAALSTPVDLPAAPYTPTIKSFSIDYSASSSINLNPAIVSDDTGHFYHLLPFGHAEQNTLSVNIINLLANFNNEGVLFIGIENFAASQSIQILFQLSEGSANPLKNRQHINWSYLIANNQWKEFGDGKVKDATNDLTVSAIIHFGFDDDAAANTTLFPEQIFWIKGEVKQDSDAVCNIIQLYAQAILVTFTDYLKTGNYYKAVLPASTISKLVVSDAAVKKITQPYTSFGGVTIESNEMFYVRVSERLRHKNRAITMWDYEHLVLQNFSQIYKVKCLNHTLVTLNADNTESDDEMRPGYVVVVPLPDLRNKNAIDPLKPTTSLGVLDEIKLFLRKHITPFVKLQVKNPRFEEIQLDFKVKFFSDDTAFYHDTLQTDIEKYLSPWAYDVGADIEFGGKIYKSVLLNFVEERPYVDFVTCFKMYHYVDNVQSADVDEATATSARTVLVSYEGKHLIDYTNVDCNCQ